MAVVEDVGGQTLETLVGRDPRAAEASLEMLRNALRLMAAHRSAHIGKIALVERGQAPQDRPPEQVVLDRALRHLATVAGRVERVASARTQIEDLVGGLAGAVEPRREFGLVHGELGPDHVLVDEHGQPVIIDIEGAMFLDAEWEYAFAKMRFGRHYPRIQIPDLDPARMEFYRIAQSLSLIEVRSASRMATFPTATSCSASPRRTPSTFSLPCVSQCRTVHSHAAVRSLRSVTERPRPDDR